MTTALPKIKYILVGFERSILVDHYEKKGDFVTYTTDVFYPSIKKTGQNLQTREQLAKKHQLHVFL